MKKMILVVFTCVLMIQGITGRDIPKVENPGYRGARNTIGFLVDAIKREDAQAIKDKFSEYAVNHIDNLDDKIDRLIDEFSGWSEEYEITDTFERWSNHGKITNMLTPSFDFEADGIAYRIRIIYYDESDEDESKLGWYSIQMMERNADYSDGVYMHGVDDEPDILLWDYLKESADAGSWKTVKAA